MESSPSSCYASRRTLADEREMAQGIAQNLGCISFSTFLHFFSRFYSSSFSLLPSISCTRGKQTAGLVTVKRYSHFSGSITDVKAFEVPQTRLTCGTKLGRGDIVSENTPSRMRWQFAKDSLLQIERARSSIFAHRRTVGSGNNRLFPTRQSVTNL